MVRFFVSTLLLLTLCGSAAAQGEPFDLFRYMQRQWEPRETYEPREPNYEPQYESRYDSRQYRRDGYRVRQTNPDLMRTIVAYPDLKKGLIVISPEQRRLYLGLGGGRALRYAIGVGKDGMGWSGVRTIAAKKEWPPWTPPAEMRTRVWREQRKVLPVHMEGGPDNPLGERALYLFDGGKDTQYRIHGTNEPETIGRAVSSGCFRMTNDDVVDLYERVPLGTVVHVLK